MILLSHCPLFGRQINESDAQTQSVIQLEKGLNSNS